MITTNDDIRKAGENLNSIIRLKAGVEFEISRGESFFWIVDADYAFGQIMVDANDLYEFLKVQAAKTAEVYAKLAQKNH